MLRALFSAARSPLNSFQTTHRVLLHRLDVQNLQWRRWTSTLDDRWGQRLVLTVNPECYASVGQEILDISNESEIVLYIRGTSGQQEPIRLHCNKRTGDHFPANTVGLFYAHDHTKDKFRSIRFRLCRTVDDFYRGSDLRESDGRVWSLPRQRLTELPRHRPLLHLIQSDYPEDESWLSKRYPVLRLCPQHLATKGGSVLDISNKFAIALKFKTGTAVLDYHSSKGHNGKFQKVIFPAGSNGLFYYKQSTTAPTAIGELRFRLCKDASLFYAGKDLCLPSGLPWCIPSHFILATHEALREQLFDEGLLSPAAKSFVDETGLIVLHGLNQPFTMNIGNYLTTLIFKAGMERTKHEIQHLFTNSKFGTSSYTGRAVVQFEEYPSEYVNPHAKHRPLFALRFLELLTPVTTTTARPDIVLVQHPEPGQCLKRRTKTGIYETWGYTPYKASTQAMLSEWAKQPLLQEWQSLKADSHPHLDAPS